MVSVIVSTYNEETAIARLLEGLRQLRGRFEVIVADGSSIDHTRARVEERIGSFPCPLRVVECSLPHRALQLNRAAAVAEGNILLFLHADVLVPSEALECLEAELLNTSVVGGNYQVIFEGTSVVEKLFTWAYRVRRPFGIYYGDSGIFVRSEVFKGLGGFRPIPIMEDYEFVRRMEKIGRTVCLRAPLVVSGRRWRVQGLFRTLFSWVWIQSLYSLGVPAENLARWYAPVRDRTEAPSNRTWGSTPSASSTHQ